MPRIQFSQGIAESQRERPKAKPPIASGRSLIAKTENGAAISRRITWPAICELKKNLPPEKKEN